MSKKFVNYIKQVRPVAYKGKCSKFSDRGKFSYIYIYKHIYKYILGYILYNIFTKEKVLL